MASALEFCKKNYKLLVFLGLVVLIVVLNFVFGWSDMIANGQFIDWLKSMLVEHPVTAGIIYVVLSIIGCVVLALPGVIFAIAAGTLFGAITGTFLCWLAVTLGAMVSFLVGRYFLKDSLKPKLSQNRQLNKLFFEGAHKSDIYLLAITRLIPIFPYNLQNFAYGITDISFFSYTLYSAIFMIPGTAVYTVASAGLLDADNRLLYFGFAAILLIVTLLIAYFLKKKANIE